MGFVFTDAESQRMKERLLRDIEKYDICEMSVNVSKLVFRFRPMEAKIIDGEFTIVPELNELNDFCSANKLKYELNHERWVLSFRKDKTMDDNNLMRRLRLLMDVAHTKPESQEEDEALEKLKQEEPGIFEVFAELGKAQREGMEKEEDEEGAE